MGSHKLLEEFGTHPLVYWAVHHAILACRRVIIVLGHDAGAIQAVLPHEDRFTVVTNTEYERGMLTSIARGATEVQSDRFFVAPADMPFLRPELFRTIAAAVDDAVPCAVRPAAWFPNYHDQSGHPVLISSSVVPALAAVTAGKNTLGVPLGSMHKFLDSYTTMMVPVDDDGSIIDIDTMDALRRYADCARELKP